MNKPFFESLSEDVVVLTPNTRLAGFLRQQYDLNKQSQGMHSWETLKVLPITNWITQLCQENLLFNRNKQLLNTHQELYLWEKIITRTDTGKELLKVSATAKMAAVAWALINQWNLPFTEDLFNFTEDSACFYRFAKEYNKFCNENQFIDRHNLPELLIAATRQGKIAYPKKIILVGFDEVVPQYQRLLELIKDNGCPFKLVDFQDKTSKINKIALLNYETEIETMALWAKEQHSKNPTQSIACVVPNLNEIRKEIETVFFKTFAQKDFVNQRFFSATPFNISVGQSFSDFPMIYSALQILELNFDNLPVSLVSQLLRSAFLAGSESEMSKRSLLDAKILSMGSHYMSFKMLLTLSRKHTPIFAKNLEALHGIRASGKMRKTPNEWVVFLSEQLSVMGWPGESGLNSVEFQLLQRFHEFLSEFASIEYITPLLYFHESLEQLKKVANNIVFQPKSDKVPIQILGLLEAAGLCFDKLWVMGLHDNAWPASLKPNPFIPYHLQKKHNIPHSSFQREYTYSKNMLDRYAKSADEIILSYPLKDNERDLMPSPLISDIEEMTDDVVGLNNSDIALNIHSSRSAEYIADDVGPKLSEEEASTIRGGTAILKHQAACPFSGFAMHRLGAIVTNKPQTGLSPIERGIILHSALEELWKAIGSQKELLKLDDNELEKEIEKCILTATKDHCFTQHSCIRLEKKRLRKLLNSWIDIEKSRPGFSVISTEQSQSVSLGCLTIKIKLDRVDKLDSGEYLTIDYKTGNSSIDDWFGERPNEPQLPLYCVTNKSETDGVSFAYITAAKMCFKGVACKDNSIKGVRAIDTIKNAEVDWGLQIKKWETTLWGLADNFINGHARIDPKYGKKTCDICKLQSLCRIYEKIN